MLKNYNYNYNSNLNLKRYRNFNVKCQTYTLKPVKKVVAPKPKWLLAEVTYKCPLQCPYCSNPTEMANYQNEISTEDWIRTITEGSLAGCVQLGFSGGEPLTRPDLEVLVAKGNELGYYTNLITSGIGLTETRIKKLKESGLDSIQISFQSDDSDLNDYISGMKNSFKIKQETAKLIKKYDFPLTFNIVLHSKNIDKVKSILDMAIEMGADYIELANTQYSGGFAYYNRDYLLPTLEQVEYAKEVSLVYGEKYGNSPKIYYVWPDYYQGRPKPCMGGWGNNYIIVTADGSILPCLSARNIPDTEFPNVKTSNLQSTWTDSDIFNKFRGFDWMEEPCRSCPERFTDFGGCRCQAMLLTGNPYATDPACALSPKYNLILEAIDSIGIQPGNFLYRNMENSQKIIDSGKCK